jgi:zinc transporter, ZIP family
MEKDKQEEGEQENNRIQRQRQLPAKKHKRHISTKMMICIALIPIVVLSGMIVFLFGPGQSFLLNSGDPLPEITIERIEFQEGKIIAFLRNTGPTTVIIAQADINDRIQPAAIEPSKNLPRLAVAKTIIPFSWNTGEPYEVGVTTSDGVRFKKSVEAAALAPTVNTEQISFFAIIGTYVGIIPVLIGLLWFPFIKRLDRSKYIFFLSLTAGLLVFLGIDAIVEANKIAVESVAGVFNGQMLIAMVTIVSFLALLYVSEKLIERANVMKRKNEEEQISENSLIEQAKPSSSSSSFVSSASSHSTARQSQQFSKPLTIAMMIAIGIGLHNLGEGLAIGAAVLLGKVALSTFLIVGFTLHNTTEGLAIAAPMARGTNKSIIRKLIGMGLIAGAPAIAGAWIGGFLYSPIAAIIFLSVGAGAIFQVIFSIVSWISDNSNSGSGNAQVEERKRKNTWLNTPLISGFIVGMVIMYVTSLIVSS